MDKFSFFAKKWRFYSENDNFLPKCTKILKILKIFPEAGSVLQNFSFELGGGGGNEIWQIPGPYVLTLPMNDVLFEKWEKKYIFCVKYPIISIPKCTQNAPTAFSCSKFSRGHAPVTPKNGFVPLCTI